MNADLPRYVDNGLTYIDPFVRERSGGHAEPVLVSVRENGASVKSGSDELAAIMKTSGPVEVDF